MRKGERSIKDFKSIVEGLICCFSIHNIALVIFSKVNGRRSAIFHRETVGQDTGGKAILAARGRFESRG